MIYMKFTNKKAYEAELEKQKSSVYILSEQSLKQLTFCIIPVEGKGDTYVLHDGDHRALAGGTRSEIRDYICFQLNYYFNEMEDEDVRA